MNYELFFFGGKDDATDDFKQLGSIIIHGFKFRSINKLCFMKKLKLVARFITLFLCDGKFMNKIGITFGIHCFAGIGSDRSSRTQQLFTHNKLFAFIGNTYPVTKLGGMCWTSNIKTTKYTDGTDLPWAKPYTSTQYPDGVQNSNDFGLLYTWYSAVNDGSGRATYMQGICPDGWRIPTAAEWKLLTVFDANELRNTNFWLKPNHNNNLLKFDARGAGFYNSATHRFEDLQGYTAYWSSDTPENDVISSISACIHYFCNQVEMVQIKKTDAISVRCVME